MPYWVNGTGNITDAANHWAAVSGGAPGAGNLPTNAADAIFDANSAAASYVVTVNGAFACRDLMFSAPASGTITFAGNNSVQIFGSLQLLAGMAWTHTATTVTFSATAVGKTIRCNGVPINENIMFNGAGGGWGLLDGLTTNLGITVLAGSLVSNGNPISMNAFTGSGNQPRGLDLGASIVTMTGAGQWTINPGTNGVWTFGASTINFVPVNQSCAFTGGGLNYGTVTFADSGGGGSFLVQTGTNTFANLSMAGAAASKTNTWLVAADIIVTGTLTLTRPSAAVPALLQSNVTGAPRTITAAAVVLQNMDFMDIAGAGAAAPFAGARLGDCLGNSGITFTPGATQYWKTPTGGAKTFDTPGNWFLATNGGGGAGRVPLPQDDMRFDANSIGAVGTSITFNMPRLGRNLDFTGVTNAPAIIINTTMLFGSVALAAGMTSTPSQGITLAARSAVTIKNAGVAWPTTINFNGPGGTFTLLDSYTSQSTGGSIDGFVNGTFDANGFDFTTKNRIQSQNGGAVGPLVVKMGSGTWTVGNSAAGPSGNTPWFMQAPVVIQPGTSTIKILVSNGQEQQFVGGGFAYSNLWLSGTGIGSYQLVGANTFNNLKCDKIPCEIRLPFAGPTTVASVALNGAAPGGADVAYARLFGPVTDYFSTPHAAANDITGDIAGWWKHNRVSLAVNERIALKSDTGGNVQYDFALNSNGKIDFTYKVAGVLHTDSSTVTMGSVSSSLQDFYFGVSHSTAAGTTKFWYSADGVAWAQLGATVAGTPGALTSVPAQLLRVGNPTGTGFIGRIYRFKLFAGIPPLFGGAASANPVQDFNPNDYGNGITWNAATTGEAWTKNGAAIINSTNRIAICSTLPGGHTLAKSGGGTIVVDQVTVDRSTATPGLTWAATHSVDGGNNVGWIIPTQPAVYFSWPMMYANTDASPSGFTNTDAGSTFGALNNDGPAFPVVDAWSDNPALILADFMANRGGLTVDAASTAAAADYCDGIVTGAAGSEKRATLTLALAEKRAIRDWIETLRAYVPAWVVDAGDAWRIVADMPRAVDHSFGPSTIDANPAPTLTRTGSRDTPNSVDVQYTDTTSTPWQAAPATAEFATDDVRRTSVALPGIRRYSQAYRFAVERLNHYTLEDVVGKMAIFDYGLAVLPGDVANVTEPAFGWSAHPVRILSVSDKGNGRWDVEFREYDPAAYSSLVQTAPTIPDTGLSSPLTVLGPTNFNAVEILASESNLPHDGTGTSIIFQSRINATWTDSADPYVAFYLVTLMQGSAIIAAERVERGVGSWLSQPLQQLVGYTVSIIAVNSLGIRSTATSQSVFIDGKQFPPGDVPAITQALEVGGEVLFQWLPAPDFDVVRYEWRIDLGNVGTAWEAMTVLDAIDGLRARFKGIVPGTHRFCVRALDSVGNYSVNSRCALVTVTSDVNAYLNNHPFCSPTLVAMVRDDVAFIEGESSSLRPRWLTSEAAQTWNAAMPSPINAGTQPVDTYGVTGTATPTWRGESYDIGFELTAAFGITPRLTIWHGTVTVNLEHSDDGTTWNAVDVTALAWRGSARFIRPYFVGSVGAIFMIEGCPVVDMTADVRSESNTGTSNAATGKTVALVGQYWKAVSISITPINTNQARSPVADNVIVSPSGPNSFDVYIFDATGTQVVCDFVWKFEGV